MVLHSIIEQYIKSEEFSPLKTIREGQRIEGIAPSSCAFLIASIFTYDPRPILVVTRHYQRMHDIFLDLTSFIDPTKLSMLPSWEVLPYEFALPSEKIEAERISAIYRLLSEECCITITTVEAFLRAMPHKERFLRYRLTISRGDEWPFEDLVNLLVEYGYSREYRVENPGQFSVKGGIIDIFIPGRESPCRIDFYGDTVDSLREFDVETQRSIDEISKVTIFPRREIILNSSEWEHFRHLIQRANEEEKENPFHRIGGDFPAARVKGLIDFFPLLCSPDYLFSFLSEKFRIVYVDYDELHAQRDSLKKTFFELYNKKKDNPFTVSPEILFKSSLLEEIRPHAIEISTMVQSANALHPKIKSIPNYLGRVTHVKEDIAKKIADGWNVIIATAFEGQARRLADLFSEFNTHHNFGKYIQTAFQVLLLPLKEGFEVEAIKTIILSDHEIFGKSYRKKARFKKKQSLALTSVLDLQSGDYVVHLHHGIGIFRGTTRMEASGVERDFIAVEYDESDMLYVPLDQIGLLQKYVGIEGKPPRIDALGKKSAWNRIRQRVQQSVEELAKELLTLYAMRSALEGFQYPPDTVWQEEFEAKFEYEETPDQLTCIEDVKDDMESPRPMDRLVCGDVGYGKTEVAIRAAFKAVMAGKQVAVLVPTTILAMQHYSTFCRRFEGYPINIEMLSRFKTPHEAKEIKKMLSLGSVDIVIGTHALLSKDVVFKNLGLLIVDEEQHFGVKQKEMIKKMKALVDVLTLTATPIPRTLYMAISGIRDISLIQTPPENRQAIETYVLEDNPDIVRNAILSEIERGGQVFYVHNRVETINIQARILRELVPEARFCVAHGQMREHELEDVIIDFLEKKYDVLVSTAIIESGLDMPNVNTIIINRADTFGLSQLYQLKGRVGRSATKAYAYLFYPRNKPLSDVAKKRLQVISEYTELGSGFKIAMKDLEIRGCGNIFGKEQSGNIVDVGFDLYCQMLEDAVRQLKGEKQMHLPELRPAISLQINLYIPSDYIPDERQKMEIYKRFESCTNEKEIDELVNEMKDRFGDYPITVHSLIESERIRVLASQLGIEKIIEDKKYIRFKFHPSTIVNRNKLVALLKKDTRFSIDRGDKNVLLFQSKDNDEQKKLEEIKKLLRHLA
ncbi:MAG: transcription-repair coupling factor [Spirochaetes bacterium]|nr:transcription-repair coupling factor [Spirochaetota bacterium]